MFDPYRRWLRISSGQRPLPAWRLLGIDAQEGDPRVIEEAAVRQSARIRRYQLAFPQESTRLLNEIAQALNASLEHASGRLRKTEVNPPSANKTGPLVERRPARAAKSRALTALMMVPGAQVSAWSVQIRPLRLKDRSQRKLTRHWQTRHGRDLSKGKAILRLVPPGRKTGPKLIVPASIWPELLEVLAIALAGAPKPATWQVNYRKNQLLFHKFEDARRRE